MNYVSQLVCDFGCSSPTGLEQPKLHFEFNARNKKVNKPGSGGHKMRLSVCKKSRLKAQG